MRGKSRVIRVSFLFSIALISSLLPSIPVAQAISANPPACSSGQCQLNFEYSGDYYVWTAPISTDYTFEAWGASGGGGIAASSGGGANAYGRGGAGGYASGTRTLAAGTALYIYVGQQGTLSTSTTYNGGGGGNVSATGTYLGGFSGGGATHIATQVGTLSTLSTNQPSVLIVAGGGGGGGGGSAPGWEGFATAGGVGGGESGTAGQTYSNGTGGGAGTQLAGGSSTGTPVQTSAFGRGASATAATSSHISGGGGGGGWYGGGAGADQGGGGGGGSGYVNPLTNSSLIAGNLTMPNPAGGTMTGRIGNGLVRVTYNAIVETTTVLTITGNQNVLTYKTSIDLTATISASGRVTFFANGKRIPRCISLSATNSITCTYSPSVRGSVLLSASLSPSSNSYRSSRSDSIRVSVLSRTNKK